MLEAVEQPKNEPGAFIGIETAELWRQRATVDGFRAKHEAEYRALVESAVAVKRAHQLLDAAKAAIRSLPTVIATVDLLDQAERDARAILAAEQRLDPKETTAMPTTAQLEQAGSDTKAEGKKSKA
jgi:hypothetical protein